MLKMLFKEVPAMCIVGDFGAQVIRGISKMNPIYRCDRRDCAPLSGLTELNSDHPGSRNLKFRHVLGEMPELIFLDSGVNRGWNCCILASTDQEFSTGGCCHVSLLH